MALKPTFASCVQYGWVVPRDFANGSDQPLLEQLHVLHDMTFLYSCFRSFKVIFLVLGLWLLHCLKLSMPRTGGDEP